MTDSMNIDSEIVESLEELESLGRIQIDYFNKPGQEHGKTIIPDIIPEILSKVEIKSEVLIEKMEDEEEDMQEEEEEDMHEEIHENIPSDSMEETITDEVSDMIHNVMEVEMHEDGEIDSPHNHGLFSEGVMGEEIIEDEQVIQENNETRIYDEIEEDNAEEEVLHNENKETFQNTMEDIANETVVGEETVVESTPTSLQELQEEEEELLDQKPLTIQTHDIQQPLDDEPLQHHQIQTFLPQVATIRRTENQGKVVTSSVYVMNPNTGTLTAQSLLQSNTLLAPKDAKMTRVVIPSSLDGTTTQAIRIVPPQSKVLGSTAKTITIAQAKQMGIFTQAKINQILPATTKGGKLVVPSKKTVTVVKSPTKILPAPLVTTTVVPTSAANVVGGGPPKTQKVLIRSNSLKPGTILTTSPGNSGPTAGQVIRIPTSQALAATTLQIPAAKTTSVQYVKLVGSGNKSQTLVPVTLSKTVPVALTTSLLTNSQTAFKVVPISTAQGNQQATTTQRVFIPTSAVTQPTAVAPQSQSIAVMVPSHLIQQVKKDKVMPTLSTLRATTNGKRASTPSVKMLQKEPLSPPTPSVNTPTPNSTPGTPTSSSVQQTASISNIIKHDIFKGNETWSGSDDALLEANGIRPRKPCNCTKSMCLKLYCDCFANGEFCNQCNCTYCSNNLEHEEERQRAIKSCLDRNPTAFRPKIGKTFTGSEERRHNKGCNCRRSGCLKNYCECYEAKIPCSKNCKCVGCKNTDGASSKRAGGTVGFEAADERLKSETQNQKAIEYSVNTHRQAFSQITDELVEATCQCLVAKADKWDRQTRHGGNSSNDEDIAQSMIIEEFGRCLVQIIEVVSKSIAKHHSPVSSTT